MGRIIPAIACLGLLSSPGRPATPHVNVVADAIRGIRSDNGADAILVVFVVDDTGDPLDQVTVTVSEQGRALDSSKTDARGRVLFRRPSAGVVSVRAEDAGLVACVAHGVVLRGGGLTGVVLPLEQAAQTK